jgi:hypothetical protein
VTYKKIYFLDKTGLFTEEKGFFTKKKIPGLPSAAASAVLQTMLATTRMLPFKHRNLSFSG